PETGWVHSKLYWASPHGRPLPAPGARTLVMGVLNVTPDSFSDGGQLPTAQTVVARARELLDGGADVLDVGGESTRPNAEPVSEKEEFGRVCPMLLTLGKNSRVFPFPKDP